MQQTRTTSTTRTPDAHCSTAGAGARRMRQRVSDPRAQLACNRHAQQAQHAHLTRIQQTRMNSHNTCASTSSPLKHTGSGEASLSGAAESLVHGRTQPRSHNMLKPLQACVPRQPAGAETARLRSSGAAAAPLVPPQPAGAETALSRAETASRC